MIDKIITGYITANRRLVVPEFGAFIRKDDNSVVFVPFLKKDDGILKELITKSLAVNANEAAQMLDEYVLCIKQRLLHREGYIIEGLGQLKSDANGIIYLDYDPSIAPRQTVSDHTTQAVQQPAERKAPVTDTRGAGNPVAQTQVTPDMDKATSDPVQNKQDGASCEIGSATSQTKATRTGQDAGQRETTQQTVPPTVIRSATETVAQPKTNGISDRPDKAASVQARAGSASDLQVQPRTSGVAGTSAQAASAQATAQAAGQPATFKRQPAKLAQQRNNIVKTDKFIAIAIIAAVIAIAAIIYGILANPTPDIEIVIDPAQSATEAPATPAATTTQPAK